MTRRRSEESLAARTRRVLEPALASARRGDASLVVIDVETDAWNWEWDGNGLSASRIAREHHDLVVKILSATVPVVVRLNGAVAGLGLTLALACDLRFAAPDARFLVGPAASPAAVLSGLPWLLRDRLGSSPRHGADPDGAGADATRPAPPASSLSPVLRGGRAGARLGAVRCHVSARAKPVRAHGRGIPGALSYESWLGAMASAEAAVREPRTGAWP